MGAPADEAERRWDASPETVSSARAPFRCPDFARMASAEFVSKVGRLRSDRAYA
jgi:hypothetical protein